MPIRPERLKLYPPDWREISDHVRFVRAGGRCEPCLRPHMEYVPQLPDGRWHDKAAGLWRDDHGRVAEWPDMIECLDAVAKKVVLATAHLDHDPGHNEPENLGCMCGRCHLRHDHDRHRLMRWLGYRARRAVADLFLGDYESLRI